mmetsp:Transcript_13764/g.20279  ORF Transcript_13764/g.20279 Transcript_13764/m.20279 type:complete len:249 (+) Transcript_13764:3-749(+)
MRLAASVRRLPMLRAGAALSPSAAQSPMTMAPMAVQGVQQRHIHYSPARLHAGNTPGWPVLYQIAYDKPGWNTDLELEYEVMPRDAFGVPAHIPPEVSTTIRHTYYVPPQYYPFLKKLGDDTPELKPYMDKLINGEMTFDDYEEMFYAFAKPLKISRKHIPMPYRTEAEIKNEAVVAWEGAWLSFRQRVMGDYISQHNLRDFIVGMALGLYVAWVFIQQHRQYRIDMKLFYIEAPEHKINWIVPRGDL